MRVTCYKDDPNNVLCTFEKEHNHEIGSKDNLIFAKTCRDFRVSIQRQLNEQVQKKIAIF